MMTIFSLINTAKNTLLQYKKRYLSYKTRKLVKRILQVFLLAIITVFVYTSGSIYIYSFNSSTQEADAAIVLGAAVWGDQPSPVFRERINHAYRLYKNKQVEKIILTGGKGEADELSEAQVARNYLQKQYNVPLKDVIIENSSRTTYENLRNAQEIIKQQGEMQDFLLVSDPLHMKRAMIMAEDIGLEVAPSPTPTSLYKSVSKQGQFLMRETFYLLRYRLDHLKK